MNDAQAIGLVGLGLLGEALASRALSSGFAVVGYDLDDKRRAALADLGGRAFDHAQDVFAEGRTCILALPDSDVVAGVLEQVWDTLAPGQIILDATTGHPAAAENIGARIAATGASYLDMTVVGSSAQARRGEITLLVGGDQHSFDRCTNVMRTLADTVFYLGTTGAGSRMKLAVNLVLGLNRAVLAEGLAFAKCMGIESSVALEVLRAGAAFSRVMDTKGPRMISADFAPQARLAQHAKDVGLILELAESCGAQVPLSRLHQVLIAKLIENGLGLLDNAVIVKAFE